MKGKRKLTPRGAVWAGLLATPVLIVAVVAVLGVAVAPADSNSPAAPTASGVDMQVVTAPSTRQTLAELQAFWTPARMAAAEPYPMPTRSGPSSIPEGTLIPMAEPTGEPGAVAGALPGGTPLSTTAPEPVSQAPQHTPYQGFIPYTRWSLIGRYDKFPNFAIAKMFFQQDTDGNGTVDGTFVCSASSMGPDEVWTAGHCVSNNVGTGANAGFSSNILVCPVFDNGSNPAYGCWGGLSVTLSAWRAGGGGNVDFGAVDTSDTGTVIANTIGNVTGWLGFAWNQSRNQHWVAMGYPAGAPFAGGKIIMSASAYGYDDDWQPDTIMGVAMGSNLTGGSSGGPWIISYGLPGQVAGGGGNFINGHNDWKWNTEPEAMVSPYFDCRPLAIYNFIRGTGITCP